MTNGYGGWKDEEGQWRFQITTNVGAGHGQIMTGIDLEGDPDDGKGLTEAKFRHLMAETFGQSQADIDAAVARVKQDKTGKFGASAETA